MKKEKRKKTEAAEPPAADRNRRWLVPAALIAVVAVGSYFRLADLGLSAFRADEGFFWGVSRQNISPGEIFERWMELQGVSGQFPFAAAFTKWFLVFFHLTPNHFTVHLPSALWGIATVAVAYGLGREFAGRGFGLALAFVLALNPFHIQVSREAYFYAPLVCGAFLELWAALWIFDHFHKGKRLTVPFYLINAAGYFLLTYSQPSGWPLALCVVLTVIYVLVRQVIKTRRVASSVPILLVTLLIIGLPLLMTDWGLKQHLPAVLSSEKRVQTINIFGDHPFLPALGRITTSYAWGETPIRTIFSALVLILGLGTFARRMRADKRCLLMLLFLIVGVAFAILSLKAHGGFLGLRYLAPLLPVYLILLVSGMLFATELVPARVSVRERFRKWVPIALVCIAAGLWVYPAHLCTQLTGKPTPYKLINSWVDSNLRPGTLVLVDRWYEPRFELKDEPSTNVIYTYTVPSEPLDVFLKVRWRDTATNFFAKYPEAAYLEIAKIYWEDPRVGPWEWPRQHFSRHVAFTNEAGMKLRELGLANREDFYAATTNRLIVELFYDTRDDVLAKTKAKGERFIALFGSGWDHVKTADQRGWQRMQDKATVDLYNLTDQPQDVFFVVRGGSVISGKEVKIQDQARVRFDGNAVRQARVGPFQLPPGHTAIALTDDLWTLLKVPLLVDEVRVVPAAP